MQVSIVVPAFNEEQRVARTLRELTSYFSETDHSLELIVVDDGSEDRTAEIVRGQVGARLLQLENNRGKGAALRRGIQAASGELVFLVDADLPYSAGAFDRSLPMLIGGGCDAVIGACDLPDSQVDPSYPRHRIYMGRAFSHIVNRVLPLGIFDTPVWLQRIPWGGCFGLPLLFQPRHRGGRQGCLEEGHPLYQSGARLLQGLHPPDAD